MLVDLEVIPDSLEAEVGDAPELNQEAPEVTMHVSDASDPPIAAETTPAGASMELATNQPPEASTIIVFRRGPVARGAGSSTGSRIMKTWRVANAEHLTMTPGAELSGVLELVPMFSRSRAKVKQAVRVAHNNLERMEKSARELHDAQVEAYNMLRAQTQATDGQMEKRDREAALQAELGQLRTPLEEKDSSYVADTEHIKTGHLEEMKLKDAALKDKEEALIQKQAQLAKAMETALALEEELSRAAHASIVWGREALEVAHETDTHFNHKPFFHLVLKCSTLLPSPLILLRTASPAPGICPDTREVTETAIETSREECRAAGQEVDANTSWTVEEIGIGLRARLLVLAESMERLQSVGSSMIKAMWPEAVEPASVSRLSH
ncbi:hypothetical protein ZWY2020_046552 [Hordeum vulgare]|nr:hypothetical protein ZWY2020_046552 [Hordeum vulgare]